MSLRQQGYFEEEEKQDKNIDKEKLDTWLKATVRTEADLEGQVP